MHEDKSNNAHALSATAQLYRMTGFAASLLIGVGVKEEATYSTKKAEGVIYT